MTDISCDGFLAARRVVSDMTVTVDAGEFGVEELMDRLNEGERVVVRTEMFGDSQEVTLRFDGDVYYCDTPTRLHKHDDEDGMRACIQKQGYA